MLSERPCPIPQGWSSNHLAAFAVECNQRAGQEFKLPVLSVTKHNGIVRADEFFRKAVHGKDTSKYKVVRPGQFAYATIHLNEGSIGKLWAGKAGLVSPMYTVFDVNEQLDSDYLFAVLKSERSLRVYRRITQGTVNRRGGISFRTLSRLLLHHPPLPEQRKIAAILSSVDDAIEKTQAVIEQVQVVKRGLMQQLLTRGLPGRHTRIKQTEIGEVPEEWEIVRLGDVASIRGGKRMPKGRPFASSVTPYPYIRVRDFKNGTVDTSELEYVLPEDREQIRRYTISKDDIYISIAGTLGIVGTVPPELDGAQLTENAAKIVINDKRCTNRDFVMITLEAECCQSQLEVLRGVGGGVPKLALFRIEQIRLPLPNQQEQQEIVNALRGIGAYHSTLRARLDTVLRLKKGLMSVLLTGELRVTPDTEAS